MPREIASDYNNVREFLENYTLKHTDDQDFIELTKRLQKRYFAIVTFFGELNQLMQSPGQQTDIGLLYLYESYSDLGSTFFIALHGAYKPSKLMLRSSIETFCKGFFIDEYPEILKEKSVYVIFETIKNSAFLSSKNLNLNYNSIHNKYKELCADTHTADEKNMGKIDRIGIFPSFDKAKLNNIADTYTTLIKDYLFLLTVKYNSFFHKMDYRNRDIILAQLSRPQRAIVNGEI